MIHGARVSLTVGIPATAIALIVGSLLGALAGYYGGAADWIVSRLIEVVLCFPFLFLVLGIVALFGPSIVDDHDRARADVVDDRGAVRARRVSADPRAWSSRRRRARAARATARIIFRHLLPNALAPVLVSASFGVAPRSSPNPRSRSSASACRCRRRRGEASSRSREQYIEYAWWLVLFPGIAIFTTVGGVQHHRRPLPRRARSAARAEPATG